MSGVYVWAVILGLAVTTFLLRAIPIALLSRLRLPRSLERWLSFVPVSVMSALVVGEVMRPGGVWLPPLHNPYLLASLPTALVYHRTRSLLGATVAGILAFLAMRALLG
jgi:branched-subunit amino acid transport protein